MTNPDIVRARVDTHIKEEARAVLSEMGLSMSDAIRLLLVRVATERAFPFEIKIPNAETRRAMQDSREGHISRHKTVSGLLDDLDSDEE